jgi:hypothetical protein
MELVAEICLLRTPTRKKKKTFFNQDFADPSTITSLHKLDLSLGRAFGRTSA